MTDYSPGKATDEVQRFSVLREALWNYTVEQNNARLDALPPAPKSLMDEIKLIEGILIALLKA